MTLPAPRRGRLFADGELLLAAIIWGSAFVACRVAAQHLGPFLYTGARFSLGALTLLPLVWRGTRVEPLEIKGGILAGLLLFAGAGLQQVGIQYTTAGKAGFITGLYVVLVPVFLAAGTRRRPGRTVWIAALLAAAGLFLLSVQEKLTLAPGDAFELAGAIFWALHLITIGWLARRADVLHLALTQYALVGLLSLVVGFVFESRTLSGFGPAAWAILYTGVLSVGLGYTLQAAGQKLAPAADAAIILSAEAVFAALFGWWWLGESLAPRQLAGCGLLLAGMLVAQARAWASGPAREIALSSSTEH